MWNLEYDCNINSLNCALSNSLNCAFSNCALPSTCFFRQIGGQRLSGSEPDKNLDKIYGSETNLKSLHVILWHDCHLDKIQQTLHLLVINFR